MKKGTKYMFEVCEVCDCNLGVVKEIGPEDGDTRKVSKGRLCPQCLNAARAGVIIIEATGPKREDRTGRMVSVEQSSFRKIFGKKYENTRILVMQKPAFEKMFNEQLEAMQHKFKNEGSDRHGKQ